MPKTLLTEITVRNLKPPSSGQVTYWDTRTPIGVRVSQGGAKTFVVLIDSGRRQTIGRYPHIKLADAREAAEIILAEKTLGRIRPTHIAYDDAKEQFLAHSEAYNRPATAATYRRLLNSHFKFGRQSVGDIAPRDILRNLARLSDRPAEKHHAFVAARTFFNWCAKQHYVDRSPIERIEVPPSPTSRARVLADEELRAIYDTALSGQTTFHRIVSLLVLLGQRRSETGQLRWEWIDGAKRLITIPSTVTKNKRTHTFPYGQQVADILADIPRVNDSPYLFPAAWNRLRQKPATVFNGWGKAKAEFDRECGVVDWRLHDLRRVLSTNWAALGIPQVVTEKYINHISGGSQSAIAQIYNRHAYIEEMRTAVNTWEARLQQLLNS